ncbi:hypothetical protein J3Q64DRAFT_1700231 [Phycomyces blakesleeanus]|uniref:F-box domain-containing protein n=2 Tax=Phycomyces blakesleeanus TaxID=4837 RepID=A0A167PN32_PHYB8|nr:hypothetical protein PHYBLDRAFT_163355 [Phycomyces blakesleeanus NRRL 1555(-)]OAD78238.1 hypothetical protein PHYBLDRAFT_163355 [Phycomyces blakesleeanus NRRL 1555(-)]|eukprot:XP_018296278.1 hypothetical protein PHYBLDRAFT_163355 [Phycomyces blakesleeanus NRRL 1555(-)]
MGFSELPTEILIAIANKLTPKEWRLSGTIFRKWNELMRETQWKRIQITPLNKHKFFSPVGGQDDIYKTCGDYVLDLTLSSSLSIDDKSLRLLQRHFQGLDFLKIFDASLTGSLVNSTTDWSCWSSLTRLKVFTKGEDSIDIPEIFIKVLSKLPNLQHLDYTKDYTSERPLYTLRDLEELHSCLPQLQELFLTVDLDILNQRDLEYMLKAAPMDHLTVVKFRINTTDLRWLYYFARKYPKVYLMEWRNTSIAETSNDIQDQTLSMLKALPHAFSNLNTIVTSSTTKSEWTSFLFKNCLDQFYVPLQNIRYFMFDDNLDPTQSEKSFDDCLRYFPKSLERLSISSNDSITRQCMIPNILGNIPNLVVLAIDMTNSSIELDILLNHCRFLRVLRLKVHGIYLSNDAFESMGRHDLALVEVGDAFIEKDLFLYISQRCKRLKYMRLVETKVYGPISSRREAFCLDMSHTEFSHLQFNGVSFYESKNDVVLTQIPLRMVTLVQTKEFLQAKGTKGPGVSMVVGNTGRSISSISPWFLTYSNRINGGEGKQGPISQVSMEYIFEYYRCLPTRDVEFRLQDVSVSPSYIGELRQKVGYGPTDIRSYVKFMCAHVSKYVIKTASFADNDFWAKLCEGLA